jgi:hypothetical protein
MEEKFKISEDPIRGAVTYMVPNGKGGYSFPTVHNVSKIMQGIQEERDFHGPKKSLLGSQNHSLKIAEMPTAIYRLWVSVLGHPRDNPKEWLKHLSEREYHKFRVDERKL